MNAPSRRDVIVQQRIGETGTVFVLATDAGPGQFSYRSRDEAVSRALRYATQAHVEAWFAMGDDNFRLLGAAHHKQDTGNGRGLTMDQPADSPDPASGTRAAVESAIVPTVADWSRLIRAEYLESPGLHLTKREVQRLWGLDPPICEAVLAELIGVKFLKRTHHGTYARAHQS